MNPSHMPFPMLGRWRLTEAFKEGSAIAEPAQEGEFFPDGTFNYFVETHTHDRILKLKGKYWFLYPDRFWTEMRPGADRVEQKITVDGSRAELIADGITHILKKIDTTEFFLPIVDAVPYDPNNKS